jgi:hypothetical protein
LAQPLPVPAWAGPTAIRVVPSKAALVMAVARAARRLPDERNRCPITKIPPLCDASSVQAGTYATTQIKDEHRGANDCPAYVSGKYLAGKLDAPYRKYKINA